MKMFTANLTGAALDWAVIKSEGKDADYWVTMYQSEGMRVFCSQASTDWEYAGKIIQQEKIKLIPYITKCEDFEWHASNPYNDYVLHHWGKTPLVAAMRCFVAAKLGEVIMVPDVLLGPQPT